MQEKTVDKRVEELISSLENPEPIPKQPWWYVFAPWKQESPKSLFQKRRNDLANTIEELGKYAFAGHEKASDYLDSYFCLR
jgi:hypothetical protein